MTVINHCKPWVPVDPRAPHQTSGWEGDYVVAQVILIKGNEIIRCYKNMHPVCFIKIDSDDI